MSITDGLHVPVMPLEDVPGNVGAVVPAHNITDVPKLNVGVTLGLTVTVNVTCSAQMPAVGVNVYTPEF